MATIRTLADLQQVKQALADQQARQAAALAAEQAAKALALANKNLFANTVGTVKPLLNKPKALSKVKRPEPVPVQRQLDDQAVLR